MSISCKTGKCAASPAAITRQELPRSLPCFVLSTKTVSYTHLDVYKRQQDNTLLLITVFFVFFTLLMQVLHWLKVNVFKVVVLMGTFALALAFAGNDLVNFIGVPLAGFSSFIDYTANGSGNPDNFLMTSLLAVSYTHLCCLWEFF